MTDSVSPTRSDSRIRGLSRFLSVATLVLMVLLPLTAWGAWLFPDLTGLTERPAPGNGLGGPSLNWFILPLRLGAAGIATIPALISLYGLWGLLLATICSAACSSLHPGKVVTQSSKA